MDTTSVTYHGFAERPLSDPCSSTSTGPDGRVCIACCIGHTGGGTAEYLFGLDKVTGDLRDSECATQCKIHNSFVPDPERNFMRCAVHLSGPCHGLPFGPILLGSNRDVWLAENDRGNCMWLYQPAYLTLERIS